MRSTVFAIIAVGAAASAAHAGGPAFIEAEPQPVVAAPVAAHDWSGFYAGVSYGSVRGISPIRVLPATTLPLGTRGEFSWGISGNDRTSCMVRNCPT